MQTCSRCGGIIEFRYVNGLPVPMHVDGGGWACSGYGALAELITRATTEATKPAAFAHSAQNAATKYISFVTGGSAATHRSVGLGQT